MDYDIAVDKAISLRNRSGADLMIQLTLTVRWLPRIEDIKKLLYLEVNRTDNEIEIDNNSLVEVVKAIEQRFLDSRSGFEKKKLRRWSSLKANFQLKSRVVMEEKGSDVEEYRFWHERRTTGLLESAHDMEEEHEQVWETIINRESEASRNISQQWEYPAEHPDEQTHSSSSFQSELSAPPDIT